MGIPCGQFVEAVVAIGEAHNLGISTNGRKSRIVSTNSGGSPASVFSLGYARVSENESPVKQDRIERISRR